MQAIHLDQIQSQGQTGAVGLGQHLGGGGGEVFGGHQSPGLGGHLVHAARCTEAEGAGHSVAKLGQAEDRKGSETGQTSGLGRFQGHPQRALAFAGLQAGEQGAQQVGVIFADQTVPALAYERGVAEAGQALCGAQCECDFTMVGDLENQISACERQAQKADGGVRVIDIVRRRHTGTLGPEG